jgi:hypothetical protein
MTVRLGDIVIDYEHRQRAAEFSCAALGLSHRRQRPHLHRDRR